MDEPRYGDHDFDYESLAEWEYEHRHDPPATESEAHLEWHRNAGVPLGEPCPWDACHAEPDGEFIWADGDPDVEGVIT